VQEEERFYSARQTPFGFFSLEFSIENFLHFRLFWVGAYLSRQWAPTQSTPARPTHSTKLWRSGSPCFPIVWNLLRSSR
jgi:hypothetical protein